MLNFNPNKTNCTGCSACYSVCPVHCITMQQDEEGFLYPESSDACIHCGLCEKVCPSFLPKTELKIEQKAVAAVSRDNEVWRRSASGGAFSEICRQWADNDTLIVGAAWDGLKVHHTGVNGFDQIAPLCKSKYVSSAIEDTFIEVKDALKEGRKAIFCGCPCQVAGLKAFLRQDYENLLTIDLICHGQGSPTVFEACMRNMSDYYGETIVAYQFRAKRKRYEEDYIASITTTKSTAYVTKDPYMQLFLSQNALRPSCGENCKYRDMRRPGDITIADLKGLQTIFPDQIYPKKNWSTVVCNSQKGADCLALLYRTMDVRPITIEDVVKYNPLFARQTWFSKNREAFFADFVANADVAIQKWTVPATEYRISFAKRLLIELPKWIKMGISSIRK